MLEIKEISKFYKEKVALERVSIALTPGRVCGLLGLNGAGKSTLMKIICGLTIPSEGKVFLDEEDITGKGSKVKVLVLPTNEELMIARDTYEIVTGK